MPRSLTGRPLPIVLESDRQLPEAEQPTFFFRYPTGRQWLQITTELDDANAKGTMSARAHAIYAVLKPLLVDWRNMFDQTGQARREIPFKADDLDLLVDPGEAAELFAALQLSTDDKKKSDSQP